MDETGRATDEADVAGEKTDRRGFGGRLLRIGSTVVLTGLTVAMYSNNKAGKEKAKEMQAEKERIDAMTAQVREWITRNVPDAAGRLGDMEKDLDAVDARAMEGVLLSRDAIVTDGYSTSQVLRAIDRCREHIVLYRDIAARAAQK